MTNIEIPADDNYNHLISVHLPSLHRYLENNDLLNSEIFIFYKGPYKDVLKKYSQNIFFEDAPDDSYFIRYHESSMYPDFNKKVKNILMSGFKPRERNGAIFIERHNRKIKNKKEVLNIFSKKFNIEIKDVDFSNMNFEEQINISNSSEMLIGVHGAGFTNMMFMDESSKIFEIDPFNWEFYCQCDESHGLYGHFAKILNMKNYKRIHQPKFMDRNIESFEVDLEDLEKKLNDPV